MGHLPGEARAESVVGVGLDVMLMGSSRRFVPVAFCPRADSGCACGVLAAGWHRMGSDASG